MTSAVGVIVGVAATVGVGVSIAGSRLKEACAVNPPPTTCATTVATPGVRHFASLGIVNWVSNRPCVSVRLPAMA